MVEATVDADRAPRFLVHDRDSIYGTAFRARVRGLGSRLLAIPPRAPRANAFCERVIGTLRRDCLDHVIVRDERHAARALDAYIGYYHGRSHRGRRASPSVRLRGGRAGGTDGDPARSVSSDGVSAAHTLLSPRSVLR